MEPDREQPPAEFERLRAETGKLKAEAAMLMAEGRRFGINTTPDVDKLPHAAFAAVVAADRRHPRSRVLC